MSKQNIREWLKSEYPNLMGSFSMTNKGVSIIDIIHQYTQEQSGWANPSLIKLEKPCLLLTESGQIVTGWLRQLDDGRYFCFGNEFTSWDFEWNFDIGAVVGWKPLTPTEEA